MGAEASTFCSVSNPSGYAEKESNLQRSYVPGVACLAARAQVCGGSHPSRVPMELASPETMMEERINPWSKDLSHAGDCGPIAAALACGSAVRAPTEYLADTQAGGAIVLDSHEGPVWVDDEPEDQVVVGLDPGEISMPQATVQKRRELAKDPKTVRSQPQIASIELDARWQYLQAKGTKFGRTIPDEGHPPRGHRNEVADAYG